MRYSSLSYACEKQIRTLSKPPDVLYTRNKFTKPDLNSREVIVPGMLIPSRNTKPSNFVIHIQI